MKNYLKKYYTIGEVAKLIGVSTSLLRFWEKEFPVIRPKKSSKGNRQFTSEDIEHVKMVYHLVKVKGYTLQGAKEVLSKKYKALKNKKEVIDSLTSIKKVLEEIKNQL